MKQLITNIAFIVIPVLLVAWAFLATTYYLQCQSLKRFDNADIKYVFPGICYADIGDGFKSRIF